MKFNTAVNERDIWAIIKEELKIDGPEAMTLTRRIKKRLEQTCETALRMDRVELKQELEKELTEQYKAREAELLKKEEAIEKRKSDQGSLTREELIRILADGVMDDDGKLNTQAAKLLTDLEGFSANQQDITVNLIDYANAPDYYRTEIPEGV